MAYIIFIIAIPLLLGAGSIVSRSARKTGILNIIGHFAVLLVALDIIRVAAIANIRISLFNFFYVDALSAFFIFTIAVVNFAAALYSMSYISKEEAAGAITPAKARAYYLLFNLFTCSMFFVTAVNNLGMLWVAVEMTTLISAFLVGFYNTKQSVEAAWKYIIICSVGIIFALLGTILFYYALSGCGGLKSLNWTSMVAMAPEMNRNIIRIAFIFILVGYGTKAGLAPMHNWLPDAHSQAIGPISALLSGVLLKTAIYAILRFSVILTRAGQGAYFNNLMLFLGFLSLAISAGFVLVQKDIKRLLAYSSIEHIGIVSVGLGMGSGLGTLGALLHIFNHAVTKSLMFFGASNIVNKYQKHNMNAIRGVIKVMPFTGIALIIGIFALTGFPPFSIFFSEIIIVISAFKAGRYFPAVAFLALMAVVFGAMIYHFGRMLFGNGPKGVLPERESLSGKIAFIFLLVPICVTALAIPWLFKNVLTSVLKVLSGV